MREKRLGSLRWAPGAALLGLLLLLLSGSPVAAASDPLVTAWKAGSLRIDTEDVVSRSDLVLEAPSRRNWEAMPLGNGELGAAVWAQDGFTAQLNRVDLFPDLRSPAQLVIPGLGRLTGATDYRGRVDLHEARLVQTGGGMQATAYVHADRDLLVVDVTGADSNAPQTAELRLWPGRTPTTYADGSVAAFAESRPDERSGRRFGSVTAVTASARDATAEVVDERTVRVTFLPRANGSFRVIAAVPFHTEGDIGEAARRALAGTVEPAADSLASRHLRSWRDFWAGVAPMRIASADGTGEYMETQRALALYTSAVSMRGELPASHGGQMELVSSFQDQRRWSPAHYWHWNLRQQVNANFAADTEELNAPYYRLYLDNLAAITAWTRQYLPGTEGACVPEFIRFDGTDGCDATEGPWWTDRIFSTGAEVAYNLWRHYRYTNDEVFLERAYPLMRDVVRFYLSWATEGPDGYLQLEHVNALENQWDTSDPAPDLAALRVLLPIVARLASDRGDDALAERIREAIPRIPPFRIVQRNGEDVIAWSATDEPTHNVQNPDIEPIWPWGVLGEDSPLAQATFRHRIFPQRYDWAMDSTQAARLGLADEVRSLLLRGTEDFQIFPNGYALYELDGEEEKDLPFYQEWGDVVASGLQEGFVHFAGGILRVSPAWPREWDVDAALRVEGGHRVSAQIRGGIPNHVGIEAASTETLRVENPWPGQHIRVVDGESGRGKPILGPTSADVIAVPVRRHRSYLLERTAFPYGSYRFERVDGAAADEVKRLNGRTLGVPAPPACTTPPADRPVIEWDPEAGLAIADASPHGRDARVIRDAEYVPGPDSRALVLDGERYVRSTWPINLGRPDALTLFAEVRIDGTGGFRRLFDYARQGVRDVGFVFDLDPQNRLRLDIRGTRLVTPITLPTGRFVELAMTLETDGTVTIYFDGLRAWTGSVPAGQIDACPELRLHFGGDRGGGSNPVGAVDEMEIWPRALTAEEVAARGGP